MTDDLKERLLGLCNGHPNATIPWPHRVIHDAVAYITDLESRLAAAEAGEDALAEALRALWFHDAPHSALAAYEARRGDASRA